MPELILILTRNSRRRYKLPKILVIGEALVDLFAEPGQSLSNARNFTPHCGGAPANLAVSAAKLGGDVGFIGRVGKDGFGDTIINLMKKFGVDTSLIVRDRNRATMLACVALPSPETPDFLLIPGANENLISDDIPTKVLKNVKVYAFGAVTLAYNSAEAVLDGAKRAALAGSEVIFDVNLRPNIWPNLGKARELTLNAIKISSIIKLNLDECEFLFGNRDIQNTAIEILKYGTKLICISDGSNGSTFITHNAEVKQGAYSVKAIDTTGSGDAFLAAVAVSICKCKKPLNELNSINLKSWALFANAAGALVATKLGAMETEFNELDVRNLAKNN